MDEDKEDEDNEDKDNEDKKNEDKDNENKDEDKDNENKDQDEDEDEVIPKYTFNGKKHEYKLREKYHLGTIHILRRHIFGLFEPP